MLIEVVKNYQQGQPEQNPLRPRRTPTRPDEIKVPKQNYKAKIEMMEAFHFFTFFSFLNFSISAISSFTFGMAPR